MKAIILAAGRGSRMLNETDIKPKCLSLVYGRPLIEWQIEALRLGGIDEIAIITGYKSEMISSYGNSIFVNHSWESTNMVRSLLSAREWLNEFDCVISYSDIYYQKEAILGLSRSNHELSITYDPDWIKQWEVRFDDPLSDAESFQLDSDGFVSEIGGSVNNVNEIQGQYMGLLRITPHGWLQIEKVLSTLGTEEIDKLQMTHLLKMVIDSRLLKIDAIPYFGKWAEFDTQSDLSKFHAR